MTQAMDNGSPMTRTGARASRVQLDDVGPLAGQLDELFVEGATVHVERLDDGVLWMRIDDHVVNVSAVKRGLLHVMYEDDA